MKKTKTALVVHEPLVAPVFVAEPELANAVRDYMRSSEALNTARARRSDWAIFSAWCAAHNVAALPADPSTVVAFLSDQSRGAPSRTPKAVATVVRYSRSIHAVHKLRDMPSPTDHEAVRVTLRGIRRERGTKQKQMDALTAGVVAQVIDRVDFDNSAQMIRDRMIVLLGLATAMRGDELCAVNIEDLRLVDDGYIVTLKRSKVDQEGKGRPLAVPRLDDTPEFCPVRAIDAWLNVIKQKEGPLLRGLLRNGKPGTRRMTRGSVGLIVKKFVRSAGIIGKFGSHSLRAGFVTTARQQGVDWASIMEQTGHRRLETAKLYTRYTPDVFVATRVVDIFQDAFKVSGKKKRRG